MKSKTFEQTTIMCWGSLFFNALAFVAPLLLIIRFVLRAAQANQAISLTAWLAVFFSALFLRTVLMITGNYFCKITSDESGVVVTFLWQNIRVYWKDVVKIKPIGKSEYTHSWVVLATTLTSFHRLYGLIYGSSQLPGFIISPTLQNGEELAKLIEDRVNTR